MTHTFITKNRVEGTNNPLVVPITPTSGSTVLILGIVSDGGVARIGGTPSYNGTNMTYIANEEAGETCAEMWYILDPDIGSYNVSIPNTQPEIIFACVSVFKAQAGYTSELDVYASTQTLGANPHLDLTTTVDGDAIVDAMGCGYYTKPTDNTDTLMYSVDDGSHSDNHQYEIDWTKGLHTMGWTVAGDDWCMVAAAFKEVAIPSGAVPTSVFYGPLVGSLGGPI